MTRNPATGNAPLAARDLAVVWHPCTQMSDHETLPMIPIRAARGAWLEDHEGKRYLDAISSWWVNLFGHANPRINARLAEQAARLEHVILAGFTHQPAIELAERLLALAPAGLARCFYADNGSAAVEVALKMSFHYWRNRGRPRKQRFVTLTTWESLAAWEAYWGEGVPDPEGDQRATEAWIQVRAVTRAHTEEAKGKA